MIIHMQKKNVFIVLAIIIAVVSTGCFKKKNVRPIQQKPVVELPAGNNVLVLATKQQGGFVVIDAVRLAAPGFIVIRDDLYGKPGVVVGVSPLLPSGEARDIRLELLRDFLGTEQLYAEVRADNGDRRFRQTDDSIVLDEQGQSVMAQLSMEGIKDPFVDIKY
ncbi:MAG: hypothetical protein HY422_00625 [Candidatus Komeilibacteria bacterium]|nr:hypothetical protein [Candidatus Komeilibacteria bacterium]